MTALLSLAPADFNLKNPSCQSYDRPICGTELALLAREAPSLLLLGQVFVRGEALQR
ncbi:MAG: hypothetical protein HY308_03805 [Gammaproteobacteria bacterium]|nr:hypothetical protein [Gammaproteobacteria bacterium]